MKKLLLIAVAAGIIGAVALVSEAEEQSKTMSPPPGQHKGGMIQGMDSNEDGAITKEEFIAHATKRFSEADANNDGKITEEEMQKHRMAEKAKHEEQQKKMEAEQEKRFSEIDANGDGQISKEEMKTHMQSTRPKGPEHTGGKPEAAPQQ